MTTAANAGTVNNNGAAQNRNPEPAPDRNRHRRQLHFALPTAVREAHQLAEERRFLERMAAAQSQLPASDSAPRLLAEPSDTLGYVSRNPVDYLARGNADPHVAVRRDLLQWCRLCRLRHADACAVVASQIDYWFGVEAGEEHTGRTRTSRGRPLLHSAGDFARVTGLSVDTARRAIQELRRRGGISTEPAGSGLSISLMPPFADGLQAATDSQRILLYATTLRMVAGDVAQALVLSQIGWWSGAGDRGRCRLRVWHDGHWWAAKSTRELDAEIGLPTRRAVDSLVERGLLIRETCGFAGRPVTHLRIDEEVYAREWIARLREE